MYKKSERSKNAANVFTARQTKTAFYHLFGVRSFTAIFLVCITLVSLSWFGDSVFEIMKGKLSHNYTYLIGVVFFPLVILIWWSVINKSIEEIKGLTVREYKDIPGCKVLILFLSLPGKDQDTIASLTEKPGKLTKGLLLDKNFRERFVGGWRMPLEAIAYHNALRTLERVIVIPSADQKNGAGPKGTHVCYPTFKTLIERSSHGNVFVHAAFEADNTWKDGVNYESADSLSRCLENIYDWLCAEPQFSGDDMLIDITSGQKVGSGVASIVSLKIGRQIQYVSTTDYSIHAYDIAFEEK